MQNTSQSNRQRKSRLHWVLGGVFVCLLIPGFLSTGLAPAIDWGNLLGQYWLGLGARATFCATVLYVVQEPRSLTLFWSRYREQPGRFVGAALFATLMIKIFGLALGCVIVTDGLAIAELFDRQQGSLERIATIGKQIIWPAIYLFCGLVLVFIYNDVLACLRHMDADDWLYLKIDSWLVPGLSVSDLSKAVLSRSPAGLPGALEFIYYGMFGQIGAALILVAIVSGRREGLRYVGTILTAYYIALGLFYLWPSMGPFYTCANHFAKFPSNLSTYGIQQTAILKAKLLAAPRYRAFNRVETDYFIAFPCMHIAQPLVVLWYLRRNTRMAALLIAHDVLLIPAILLLEWHYYADLVGGVLVAVVAIAINAWI